MALDRSMENFTLERYVEYLCDPESAVTGALGVTASAYRDAVHAAWWPEPPRDHYGARPALALLLRAVIRLTRPATVVETGVAQGVTTAVILQAMAENGKGTLYSIDVPPPHVDEAYVGSLVPDMLRSRWTLRTGRSQDELAPLLAELATIDVFLHDAEHRYETQTEEYEQAWPRLRTGGLLVTDDVDTPAFMDFAARVGGAPFLVGVPTSKSGVGLMRKP
jgi:predicted O-methyltransferase YrrM